MGDDGVYRVNLNKEQDAVQEQSTDEVSLRNESEPSQEMEQEVRSAEEPTEQKKK